MQARGRICGAFFLRINICWRTAEVEAALAGFPVIEPAHFWIGVCKAVDLELSALLDAAAPE
jgi:hypothetical protein